MCLNRAWLPCKMRTITVQGQGSASRPPDQIRIELTLRQKSPDFADAIVKCNQRVAQIKAAVVAAGVADDELKTASFGVEVDSEWDQNNRRHYEAGFIASQSLFVIQPWVKERAAALFSAIIASGAEPRISFQFLVSDAEGMRQAVLANAVQNAKQRAEIIAAAGGIKLGPFHHIESGHVEIRVISDSSDFTNCSRTSSSMSAPEFNPDDITSHDGVTVTWLIGD